MDGTDGLNNNWGSYLKNPDQGLFKYSFEGKLLNAIKYFEMPVVEAIPVGKE